MLVIKVFGVEKVLKKYGKYYLNMCGNPDCWLHGDFSLF